MLMLTSLSPTLQTKIIAETACRNWTVHNAIPQVLSLQLHTWPDKVQAYNFSMGTAVEEPKLLSLTPLFLLISPELCLCFYNRD